MFIIELIDIHNNKLSCFIDVKFGKKHWYFFQNSGNMKDGRTHLFCYTMYTKMGPVKLDYGTSMSLNSIGFLSSIWILSIIY